MPLRISTQAPEFTLPSTTGEDFSLNSISGTACVLYFYPRDFTPTCTKQACSFRDQFAAFRDLDVPILGINRESPATHLKFKEQYKLPFDLLSDEKGKVGKAYKVLMPVIGITKRITYLLDTSHRIVAVHDELFGDEAHVMEMLKKLN